MFIINDLYSKYGIEYDAKDKILFIREKIPVAEFVRLKNMLENILEEVLDIRVNI